MFETDTEQERGQVGIGTLIVFIALVLVAAIAAGVLINTAGFLQTQAEQTGEESTAQVANNVDFTNIYGDADSGSDEVSNIQVGLQLAPGSDAINTDEVQVQVFVEDGGLESGTINEGTLESGETIEFALNDIDEAVVLNAGQSAEIVITTEDGSQTETVISAPDPVTDDGEVRL